MTWLQMQNSASSKGRVKSHVKKRKVVVEERVNGRRWKPNRSVSVMVECSEISIVERGRSGKRCATHEEHMYTH